MARGTGTHELAEVMCSRTDSLKSLNTIFGALYVSLCCICDEIYYMEMLNLYCLLIKSVTLTFLAIFLFRTYCCHNP